QPDGYVDKEDGPPAQAEQVGLDEQPAQDDARERGGAVDDAEDGEGPAALVGREGDLDEGQDLREQQGRGRPLEQPGGDERGGAQGKAAQGRGQGEPGDPDQEDALAAVDVAEPAAGDQAEGVGQAVAGDDQLDLGVAGAGVGLDGRQGQVDDEEVEHAQEA